MAREKKPITYNYQVVMEQLPLVKEAATLSTKTPDDVYRDCKDLADLAQEAFQVLSLNTKNFIINRTMVSLGLADASLVHPREVFRPLITDGACAGILVHNHPSGDPTPSAEDIRITKQMVDAGKLIDIRILDHIIIGRGEKKYLSMREEGIIDFG